MKKKIVLIASVACLIYLISVNFTLLFPPTGTIEELAATEPNFAMFKRENIKKTRVCLYGDIEIENHRYYDILDQQKINGLFDYLLDIELKVSENIYLDPNWVRFRLKDTYDYYDLYLTNKDNGTYVSLTYTKQTFDIDDQYHEIGFFTDKVITYDDIMEVLGIE